MKLTEGLITDVNPIDSPSGSWRYARNGMVIQTGAISNELGFDDLGMRVGKIICGRLELPNDEVLLFLCFEQPFSGSYIASEIMKVRADDSFITLAENINLRFNPNFPVSGVFKYNNKGELIICITDDNTPPKLINLKDTETYINFNNSNDYNLALDLKVCSIGAIRVQDGGSTLSGTYSFAFEYVFTDNSKTGVFFISNGIPIFKLGGNIYDKLEGDTGGEFASKSIRLDLINLDTRFKSLIVYVIKTVNQITTAEFVNQYDIFSTNLSIVYTGSNTFPVELSQILTSYANYSKIKAIVVHQDWLYGVNVGSNDIDVNFQQYANNIVVKWNAESNVSLNTVKNSYKDPSTVYIKKTFTPFEVIALYIRLVLKSGQRSVAYHIAGRTAISGELDNVSLSYLTDIDPTAKNFHLINTARKDSGRARGLMGYWENETERYPNNSNWGSLANTPVRHHRFPDFNFLKTELGGMISGGAFASFPKEGQFQGTGSSNDPAGVYMAAFFTPTPPVFSDTVLTVIGVSGTASKNYPAVSYTIPVTGVYDFHITAEGQVNEDNGLNIPNSSFRLIIYKGTIGSPQLETISVRNHYFSSPALTPAMIDVEFESLNLPLSAGDYITIAAFFDMDVMSGSRHYFVGVDVGFNLGEASSSSNNGIQGNLLGIELSNINIPDDIKSKIQGFEILYAQKTLNNSQIIGDGLLVPQDWHEESAGEYETSGRFYSFDMLVNKPQSGVSHIKINSVYGSTGTEDILVVADEYDPISLTNLELQKVDAFEYVPNDNTAVEPSNEKREEYIHLFFSEELPSSLNNKVLQVQLHSLKKDIYLSFDKQVLVSTGSIFPAETGNTFTTPIIHGGDTFFSPYGINLRLKNVDDFVYKTVRVWSFSASNIGLRTSEREWDKKYYPIAVKVSGLYHLIADELINDPDVNMGDAGEVIEAKQEMVMKSTDYYSYNLDYSRLNSLVQGAIFLNTIGSDDYPNRVIRALPSIKESNIETWRNFPQFDYYEMPKEKGEIWNVESLGDMLLIHQKYMLYRTRGNSILKSQNNEEIQLGEGDVFDFRPTEVIPINLSYAGTQSKYACLICKMGYVFIDGSQGRIFAFSNGLQEISNKGMSNYFNEFFKYTGVDNPYQGQGFSLAFDNRYNRLLVSLSKGGVNITLSYSLNLADGRWAFYHSYAAGVIFNTPNKLFSIEMKTSSSSRSLFKHNSINKKGIYYRELIGKFVIDVPIVLNNNIPQRTYSVAWMMDRLRNGSYIRTHSFDQLFIYNTHQATELFNLLHYDFSSGNIRNMKNIWLFDLIRNIGKGGVPIINGEINMANLDLEKPWYDREELDDLFVIVRFVYENNIYNGTQDTLFLYDVTANNIPKLT